MKHRILFFGTGDLGLAVLEHIVEKNMQAELTFVDINAASLEQGKRMTSHMDAAQAVRFEQVDATDMTACRALIRRVAPDIIVNLTTLLPVRLWWDTAAQPGTGEQFNALGFGPWASLQFRVLNAICEAVATDPAREAHPVIVNASYPDVANAVMTRRWGLDIRGTGNIRLLEKQTITETANTFSVPESEVTLTMRMDYSHLRAAMMHDTELPDGWEFDIYIRGALQPLDRDAAEALLLQAGGAIPMGELSHVFTAVVITEDITRILDGANIHTQMAGPCGKVGGWPVQLRGGTPELTEADSATEAAASDGIRTVDDEGTVFFTDEAQEMFLALVGVPLHPLRAADINSTAAAFQKHFSDVRARVLQEGSLNNSAASTPLERNPE